MVKVLAVEIGTGHIKYQPLGKEVSSAVILWASLTVKLSKENWPLAAFATGQDEADQ